MLHELFITHCTNGTSIMNPFTFIKDSDNHVTTGSKKIGEVRNTTCQI